MRESVKLPQKLGPTRQHRFDSAESRRMHNHFQCLNAGGRLVRTINRGYDNGFTLVYNVTSGYCRVQETLRRTTGTEKGGARSKWAILLSRGGVEKSRTSTESKSSSWYAISQSDHAELMLEWLSLPERVRRLLRRMTCEEKEIDRQSSLRGKAEGTFGPSFRWWCFSSLGRAHGSDDSFKTWQN